jgi:hypothetical protein
VFIFYCKEFKSINYKCLFSGRLPGTDQRDGRKQDTRKQDGRKQDGSTYYETDLDNGQSKDLAQVTALLASYHLLPEQPMEDISQEAPTTRSEVGRSFGSPPPSTEEGTSAFRTVVSFLLNNIENLINS